MGAAMNGNDVDPRFMKGLLLVCLAICACGFMCYASVRFYDLLHAEFFPNIGPAIAVITKGGAIFLGIYLGLKLIGGNLLKAISDCFVEDRGRNIFSGMFD